MTKVLYAKPIVDLETEKLQTISKSLKVPPKLVVFLVGEDPASKVYVKNKEKFCLKLGIKFELVSLSEKISKKEFLNKVHVTNNDETVTGFFVQLPVPSHLQGLDITQLINPIKDVDGFHENTINNIYKGNLDGFIPCTPKGILSLLDFYSIDVKSKHVVIIGRSYIVGKPLSLLLTARNATVTLCHSSTKNLKQHTRAADIIISAVGRPKFINSEYLRDDQSQVVIDVGVSAYNNSIVGDVDFSSVVNQVQAISPVPGGVGPMTVLSLMQNILHVPKD